MATLGEYQFAVQPRPVRAKKTKYRETGEQLPRPVNIMSDSRVIRGNTYAALVVPASEQQELEKQQEIEKVQKRKDDDRQQKLFEDFERNTKTPEPVDGRIHIDTQTETLLEVLTNKPAEKEVETQTDPRHDRPSSPLFNPPKYGVDIETQIEEGELFDFEAEVEPILQVLLQKTLDQGQMELYEEAELNAIRAHRHLYEQRRNADIAECQRLEAEEQRLQDEKTRRQLQSTKRSEQMRIAHRKYLGRIMSKAYLQSLVPHAMQELKDLNALREDKVHGLEAVYRPWLLRGIMRYLGFYNSRDEAAEAFISVSVHQLLNTVSASKRGEIERRQRLQQEIIAKKKADDIRKADRRHRRVQRQKERELKALKLRIEEEIIKNGRRRDFVLSQVLSDVDSRQKDFVIGTPGGLIGELLWLIAAYEELAGEPLNDEIVMGVVTHLLTIELKATHILLSYLEKHRFEEFCAELGVSTNILYECSEAAKAKILDYVLNFANALEGSAIHIFARHREEFGIRPGLLESIIGSFWKILMAKGKDALREKILIKLLDVDEPIPPKAVIKLRLTSEGTEENIDDYLDTENLEDRALLVLPTRGELSVFVVHKKSQRFLRKQFANFLNNVKGVTRQDMLQLLDHIHNIANAAESKLFRLLAPELPVFEYEVK
mmetsp:Transcript_7926/g.15384  ORF Transcript_7926/g.15384 Transcript_7926/m.15384 type:complete len:661 (+) Transcript_7926:2882-4864(+)